MSEETPMPEKAPPRLRRIARPSLVIVTSLLVLIVAAFAVLAGSLVSSPVGQGAQGDEEPETRVTARVERRMVLDGIQVVGTVVPPTSVDLLLPSDGTLGTETAGSSAEQMKDVSAARSQTSPAGLPQRNVVTAVHQTVGKGLAPGELLAEVSGRPVLAVAPGTPLFRDLVIGVSGTDVQFLQQLLADLGYDLQVDGMLDGWTMDALVEWYRSFGFEPVWVPNAGWRVPWRELLPLPGDGLTVTAASPVGRVLDTETALVTVRIGAPTVLVTADALQIEMFQPGATVYAQSGGQGLPTQVLSRGELTLDEATGSSGYPIAIRVPDELIPQANTLSALTISTAPPQEPVLAVPLIAVEEEGGGSFVVLAKAARPLDHDDTPRENESVRETRAERRVPVEVLGVSGGWVAIAENPRLPEGTELELA